MIRQPGTGQSIGRSAGDEIPIRSKQDLVAHFARAGKPRRDHRVGTEYEKHCLLAGSGRPLPYSGEQSIERLLGILVEEGRWQPKREGDVVIALDQGQRQITLEPGGQVELSGAPLADLHAARLEWDEHVSEIRRAAARLGGARFAGSGITPVAPTDDIGWLPKNRYLIMAPYLATRGDLAHSMMKQTATVQVNVDYEDEADAVEKLRLSLGIAPLLAALFANSPISEGRPNGFLSRRVAIWRRTDPDRSGLIRSAFDPAFDFEGYVDFALSVPMLFVQREGRYVDLTGRSFADHLRLGFQGEPARLSDWELHLSTLFTEARLKTYIEVRTADAQLPSGSLCVPALVKGVLCDGVARAAAWDLVKHWSWQERVGCLEAAAREGPQAHVRGRAILDDCRELVKIARAGLQRQADERWAPAGEEAYLAPIEDLIVGRGISPAEEILSLWQGEWRGSIDRYLDFISFGDLPSRAAGASFAAGGGTDKGPRPVSPQGGR